MYFYTQGSSYTRDCSNSGCNETCLSNCTFVYCNVGACTSTGGCGHTCGTGCAVNTVCEAACDTSNNKIGCVSGCSGDVFFLALLKKNYVHN